MNQNETVPPGYRLATLGEQFQILKRGTAINSAKDAIRRCKAEIRAATLEMYEAERSLSAAKAGMAEFYKSLGIEGAKTDIVPGPGDAIYILEQKEKRMADPDSEGGELALVKE